MIAIDPGTTQSAVVVYDGQRPVSARILGNESILCLLEENTSDILVYEMVACYGMAVGFEVFETVLWLGRFLQAHGGEQYRIYRRDVKLHLCGNCRAKDPNVRQALIDRFGPGKQTAIGTKKSPGPLYGIKKDMWAALAVAVTFWETSPCLT
jgi:hypothetical protein